MERTREVEYLRTQRSSFSSDEQNVVDIWEDSGESREDTDLCWAMIVLQALGYVLFILVMSLHM